jgi:hypothetical protein
MRSLAATETMTREDANSTPLCAEHSARIALATDDSLPPSKTVKIAFGGAGLLFALVILSLLLHLGL